MMKYKNINYIKGSTMIRSTCISIIGVLMYTFATMAATVSPLLSYQGLLTDTTGTPRADSSYSIEFALYDKATNGIKLWTETQPAVVTKSGLFSVVLGSVTPFSPDFFAWSPDFWLSVKVEDEEAFTRSPLGFAAFAGFANVADSARFAQNALRASNANTSDLSKKVISTGLGVISDSIETKYIFTKDTSAQITLVTGKGNSVSIDKSGNLSITGTIQQESWTAPTLLNSWTNYNSTYSPAGYFKDKNGIVYIRGLVKGGTLATTVFTLPAGYRPQYSMILSQACSTGFCRVDVRSDGSVMITANGSTSYTSLEGISFRAY